jgi:hypothetical protein
MFFVNFGINFFAGQQIPCYGGLGLLEKSDCSLLVISIILVIGRTVVVGLEPY